MLVKLCEKGNKFDVHTFTDLMTKRSYPHLSKGELLKCEDFFAVGLDSLNITHTWRNRWNRTHDKQEAEHTQQCGNNTASLV